MEDLKNIFYVSTYSNHNHTFYLHFRGDIYIPVGCDHRSGSSFSFMQEVRLEPHEVKPTTKERVRLWTDMGTIAFESLITGIMIHNP
ncbi:hypothetical protein [Erwinia phage FBB1]|nr:hypothetical protein [Erwinia phage FBB1]